MFVPLRQTIGDSDRVSYDATKSGAKVSCVAHRCPVKDPRVHDALVNVALHYGTSACVLALRQREKASLQVVAVNSETVPVFQGEFPLVNEDKFQLFHHHIRRALPTIIYNAAEDKRLMDDPLVVGEPHVRFYAAAPIVSANNEYLGTLCIVDNRPNTSFSLNEADYLCDQAQVLASLL
eukprot:TRINITY_DN10598_c0_g3_i1.p1 TRINITY_DN10598_c0_g3~~TRINITY_DN10598_c0_g3_i1.p1  ORF type:complete len:179 (+),score=25.60 TRINITY_DN10598_c0_g3_i1:55-591(+)